MYVGGIMGAFAVDRVSRLVKRICGKSMSWKTVEDRVSAGRGTVIYLDSGLFASVWWTPDEERLANSADALANAVLVQCPWRFRRPSGLSKVFPNARIAAFDRTREF
jgi:hypothetical protein